MLQPSSRMKTSGKARHAAREQAAAAVQQWLDLEAEAVQPSLDPGRRVVGPWPFASMVVGACVTWTGVVCTSSLGDPVSIGMAIGGLLLAGAGVGTAVERVRRKLRLANLVRVAGFATGCETPDLAAPRVGTPDPQLPPAIAAPLERARSACAGITRIAGDPAWTRLQVPVKEHEVSARAQFQALEERARRLAMVGEMLAPTSGLGQVPEHLQELAGVYEAHCQGMLSAAEVFERAQASLARALLALTAGVPGAGTADAALRDIGAAFDSLAQVLESLGRAPALAEAPPTAARPERVKG